MNVLSLFDGISCLQLAFKNNNINISKYYSSEIDLNSIKNTQKHFPNTIQLGSVDSIDFDNIPDHIDLLAGGFPCQSFSLAGSQKGFNDERGNLFFKLIEAKNKLNPKYFLFENVVMKPENLKIINDLIGVEGVKINSSLVSGQNRERYYWTNLPFTIPNNKNIVIKDILDLDNKAVNGTYTKNNKTKDDSSECYMVGVADNIKGFDIIKRVYSVDYKSPTLTTISSGNSHAKIALSDKEWRRLSPLEYERLQTLPDNYTQGFSNSQRYKMVGNCFTVDIISLFLSSLR